MGSRYAVYHPNVPGIAVSKVVLDDGALRIEGRDKSETVLVEIIFDYVLLTRIADEGVRLKLWGELGDIRGLALRDQQSDLIAWIDQEGLGTRDLTEARHYIFSLGEEVIDVVALSEPKIVVR